MEPSQLFELRLPQLSKCLTQCSVENPGSMVTLLNIKWNFHKNEYDD